MNVFQQQRAEMLLLEQFIEKDLTQTVVWGYIVE